MCPGSPQLDTRAALAKGRAAGLVVVPGDPDKSRPIVAVRYTDPDLKMPPKTLLSKRRSRRSSSGSGWARRIRASHANPIRGRR
jgi:hypothetical protein